MATMNMEFKNDFSKYLISKEDEQELWSKALFVFDSSALLSFYDYSKETLDEIFSKTFEINLKDRIWVPSQVEFEYLKNRERIIKNAIKPYNDLENKQLNTIEGNFKKLKNDTKLNKKHPYVSSEIFDEFEPILNDFIKKIKVQFKERQTEIEELISKDTIHEAFIKHIKVGREYTYNELYSIVEEGENRYRNAIPPGYEDGKDARKKGLQKYGDLILWKQILSHSEESNSSVVFITDDVKEDWWREKEKPRYELILEFHSHTSQRIWMYNSSDFFKKANDILNLNLSSKSLKEVEELKSNIRTDAMIGVAADWCSFKFDTFVSGISKVNSSDLKDNHSYLLRTEDGEALLTLREMRLADEKEAASKFISDLNHLATKEFAIDVDFQFCFFVCESIESADKIKEIYVRTMQNNPHHRSRYIFKLGVFIGARVDDFLVDIYEDNINDWQ